MQQHFSSARRRVLGRLLAVIGVALAAVGVTTLPAVAHHALLSGQADCYGNVRYTSTAWSSNVPKERTNDLVLINVQVGSTWKQVGSGAYNSSDNYSFSGTFKAPTTFPLKLQAVVSKPWGDGAAGGQVTEIVVSAPSGCGQPPTPTPPTATSTNICSTYAVTVKNPADAATTYQVTQNGKPVQNGSVNGHNGTSTWTSTTLPQGSYHVVVTSPHATKPILDTTITIPGCSQPPTTTAHVTATCSGYDITVANVGGGTTAVPFEVTVNGVTSTVTADSTEQHVTGTLSPGVVNTFSVSQNHSVLAHDEIDAKQCAAVVSPPSSIPKVAPAAVIRANCTGFITVLDNTASTVSATFVVTTNAGKADAKEHRFTVAAGKTSTPAKWPVVRGVSQTVTVAAPGMEKVTRTFSRDDCAEVSAPTTSGSGSTTSSSGTTSSASTTHVSAPAAAPSSVPSSALPKTGNQLSPLMVWAGGLLLMVGLTLMRSRKPRRA